MADEQPPKKKKGQKAVVAALRRAQRRGDVLELRIKGKSCRAIAEELGISKSTANNDSRYCLDELNANNEERTEHHRRLELERCDRMFMKQFEMAEGGDTQAAVCALKIMQQRSKYTGAELPQTHLLGLDDGRQWQLSQQLQTMHATILPPHEMTKRLTHEEPKGKGSGNGNGKPELPGSGTP